MFLEILKLETTSLVSSKRALQLNKTSRGKQEVYKAKQRSFLKKSKSSVNRLICGCEKKFYQKKDLFVVLFLNTAVEYKGGLQKRVIVLHGVAAHLATLVSLS